MTAPTAHTTLGQVDGLSIGGLAVFRGIRYATAERFQRPRPIGPFEPGARADRFGPQCPQVPGVLEKALGSGSLPADEDCLSLNITTPACDGGARPVVVWIHGGAFVTGTASTPWYDGAALAGRGDVVVVAVNYRLGAFGFLGTSNLGLHDQRCALAWVRANITAFGGDPGNVTVVGESAGGASVVALVAAGADTDGPLFHRAFAMSPSIPQFRTGERAIELADAFRAELSRPATEAGVDEVLAAQAALLARRAGSFDSFAPAVDGELFHDSISQVCARSAIPMVIGTTRDEMRLFNAFDPAVRSLDQDGVVERLRRSFGDAAGEVYELYQRHRPSETAPQLLSAVQTDHTFRAPAWRLVDERATGGNATWMYWFTWQSPVLGGAFGACHGLDIPFLFHNLDQPGVSGFAGDGADRVPVADRFSAALIDFARRGDPGWPAVSVGSRPTLCLGAEATVVEDPEPELRALWERRA